MWLVRLALRRPYTVAVLCLFIALMGLLSIGSMPVDVFPAVDIPVVIVVWSYPGMSAEDMERRITLITERAYSTTVNGISRMDSRSITGLSIIRVYFESGADIGSAIAQIASVSLTASRVMPPGITPPVVLQYNASNVPVAQLTLSGEHLSEQQLFDYGLNFLRVRLFTIPGLSTPAPYGGKQRQIMVDFDPARAASHGVSPLDVVQAVLAQNVILPAGSARIGPVDYDVLVNASPPSAEDFNALPVRIVNHATVHLGDVAHVHDGYAVQQNVVRVNGKRASYLVVLKKQNASTLAVIDAAREMIPQLKASAPEGMEMRLDFDQSVFVRAAVGGVLREAAVAAALVALMIVAFVGSWRSTLIVCLSIPVAILVGIIGLKLTGQTLNLMTLGGLALAIGMLVDDATVEIENINRNRDEGKGIVRAVLDGARQVATPALAATVTICIVFFPVVLLTGPAKYLFIPLAVAVVFSMMASYLLSRTLVPTLAHLLLGRESRGQHELSTAVRAQTSSVRSRRHRLNAWRERHFERLLELYSSVLAMVLRHRKFVLASSGVGIVLSGLLVTVVGLDFFPSVDAGMLRFHLRAPSGTRIEETERMVDAVERRIRDIIPMEELELIDDNIGLPVSYNLGFVQTDNVDGADAEILVAFARKHRPTRIYAERIRQLLSSDFPTLTGYFEAADVVSRVLNFGLSAPIDVQVQGADWKAALPIAIRLERELREIPGTKDVRIAQVLNHPALSVDIDRDEAATLGLSQQNVASSLLTTLSSSSLVSPNFWVNPENNVNYSVAVQTPLVRIRTVHDLMTTPITPGGQPIAPAQTAESSFAPPPDLPAPPASHVAPLLGSVARTRRTTDRSVVTHESVQQVLDVQCNVDGRDLGATAREIDRAIARIGTLPPGVSIHVRGQSETMFRSFGTLALGLGLAVILVYFLLVVLFQSWLDPVLILGAIPGALSGILWLLVVTKTTLNVESFMGAIMATGIAVSNSILLVYFANDARMADPRISPGEAAFLAGRTRMRPVIMTALAMILGMLPMALGLGEGGEQNAPLGRAVIGGLLAATVFTLSVVPAAYAVLRKERPQRGDRDRRIQLEYEQGAEADPHPGVVT